MLSTFRNFGCAEVTGTLKCKRKMAFPFAFLSFFRNFAHNIYSWDMRTEHLDFITFCVGSLSDALRMSASQVYGALRSSGVLNDYIVPCYDVLHTFSKDYLVEELTEVLKERGALA